MTCRTCKEFIRNNDEYLKVGVRHYKHWNCAFEGKNSYQERFNILADQPTSKLLQAPHAVVKRLELQRMIEMIVKERTRQPSGGSI